MNARSRLPVEHQPGMVVSREGLFPPNATTRLLASLAAEFAQGGSSVLDLGCGSGVVGFHIADVVKTRFGQPVRLSLSDVSELATGIARRNAHHLGVRADVRTGSVFEPWTDRKFDLIVSDISAVVPTVGVATGWFNGAPNESGVDGSGLAVETIMGASAFLEQLGRLVLPVLSLSNETAIVDAMHANFSEVQVLSKIVLPFGSGKLADSTQIESNPYVKLDTINGLRVFEVSVYSLRFARGKNDEE